MTSTDLYRDITDLAHDSPGWIHTLAEIGTDGGLLMLAAAAALVWWRARHDTARQLALALLVPVATVVAYACSEVAKTLVDEERPCRAVSGAAPSIADCPPTGDWSFPSNHATLAAALAVGTVIAWRRAAVVLLPVAALLAFSRVFVGVHYPHDVAAGCALGAVFALVCARLLTGPVATRVTAIRAVGRGGPLGWVAGPGPRAAFPGGQPAGTPARHRR
ncbi:phosphatase PAP2 family protein [Streptomyces sp. LX-29]|uniref:phosphatase PAP2 family protein n=1 Tax=Streptomyces sp. LX-29 TaxID=2900152 RepID=UPI00240D21E2|nr:phosphatase PAP2 family protein [Streptomyces sp. LX-29]WFB08118.1 phosphatase PAP2 family protein [Streptomyces sp. LX-29]